MTVSPIRLALTGAVFAAALLSSGAAFAQTQGPAPVAAADPTRLFADSQIIVQGRISVEVIGHGPDLIFVPGLSSSRETWRATAERLRGRYRVHLVQVAGFAGEPSRDNGSGDLLIPTAEAIDAYIVARKLSPAVLIGHSLGGTMALYLAIHHPDHLRKVMVVDSLPFYAVLFAGPTATVQSVTPMANAIRASAGGPPRDNTKMVEGMVSSPADRAMVMGWSKASDSGAVVRALADDLTLDMRPDLGSIHTPITLLYPDNVPAGAPKGSMDGFYHATFAPAGTTTLVRIDNSLHFIMLDQPAAFAAQLDSFLAN